MGDKNPIRTLRDYSRSSHKGYRNTIELPDRNNVVPLRSDTIRLVQNRCSFYGLRSEDPNQHLKDFIKLVDSLDLDVANRERTRLCLFQFSLRDQASNWLECLLAGSISTWEDLTTLNLFLKHGLVSRTYSKKSLIMASIFGSKYKQNDASTTTENIPLGGFRRSHDESHTRSKEKVKELKEYMSVIGRDFMQLSLEVIVKLREELRVEENRVNKTEKITRAETVKANHLLMQFWPSIGDGNFAVGKMSVSAVGDPMVKLSHHCIATTISGRKDSTQRITEIDLFYLYCIYKSLIAMGIVMELHDGAFYWPMTREVGGDDEAEEAVKEEAGGSANAYRDMTLGWLLEEIYVTWPHIEKKRTRLRLYTKSLEEYAYSVWRWHHILLRRHHGLLRTVPDFLRRRQDPTDSKKP
ncbi:hypothetical protein Tco_0401646 [Tanacetum coccineum]